MSGHRRLPHLTLPPADALARGPAVLECADNEAASFWTDIAERALVLGRSARNPDLDRAVLTRAALPVHQRASGGGAVLWDNGLLSLDVMLPAGHPQLADDVVASYRWVAEAVRDGLRDLGVPAEVLTPSQARGRPAAAGVVAAACFGGFSPWEIVVGDRKLVGLCQIRRRNGGLLQVGIARRLNNADLIAALGGDEEAFAELEERTGDLGAVHTEAVIAAVDAHLDAVLGTACAAEETADEQAAAAALARSRFAAR